MQMQARFKEERATQVAGRLLQLNGGRMNVLKLIKLLYLVDRAALIRSGRPVTYDSYVSMTHGPVLSLTLDKINAEPDPGRPDYWHQYIAERQANDISLKQETPSDQLSLAHENLIAKVFKKFGHMSQWELRDWCHENLPEWKDPDGTSIPIAIRDILTAAGIGETEAQSVEDALAAEALFDQITR